MEPKRLLTGRPKKTQPSLVEFIQRFGTEERCVAHLERVRWPEGLRCIRCGRGNVHTFEAEGKTGKARHLYHCRDCRYQYSVTTGTLFHDTHLPLTKWFLGIYLVCSAKQGISAKGLQRLLSTSYKTALYMVRRIRLALQQDDDLCRQIAGVGSAVTEVTAAGAREETPGKVKMRAGR